MATTAAIMANVRSPAHGGVLAPRGQGEHQRGLVAAQVFAGDPRPGKGCLAAEGHLAFGYLHPGRAERVDGEAQGIEDAP